MHRRPLLDALDHYEQSDRITADERQPLERLRAFVEAHPTCFDRTLLEGHITGSAWILNHDQSATLLTHHKKLNLWLQPGGHADGDPDVRQVALREAIEESGIEDLRLLRDDIFDVDVHRIPARKDEPAHYHYDVRFVVQAPPNAQFVVSEESHALAWVPRADVANYQTDESVLRMVRKWSFGS
ncbi:MAG: NUDIX hydrolase [Myxococcota bacterium]